MAKTDAELSLGFNLDQAKKDVQEIPELLNKALDKIKGKGLTELEQSLNDAVKSAEKLDKPLEEAAHALKAMDNATSELKALSELKMPLVDEIKDTEKQYKKAKSSWENIWKHKDDEAGAEKNLEYQFALEKELEQKKALLAELEVEEEKYNSILAQGKATIESTTTQINAQKTASQQLITDAETQLSALESQKLAEQGLVSDTKQEADNAENVKENLEGANTAAGQLAATVKSVGTGTTNPLNNVAPAANNAAKAFDTAGVSLSEFQGLFEKVLTFDRANAGITELVRHLLELKSAESALKKMNLPPELDSEFKAIHQDIIQTTADIRKYDSEFKKASSGTSSSTQAIQASISSIGGAIKSGLSSAVSSVQSMASNLKGVTKIFGTLKSSATTMIKNIKSAFNGLGKAIQGVKSHFNGMASNMKSNFKHMLTSITKYVFGFRSLFFLVRRIRKYIGEGIQSMAKFSGGNNSVNRNISQLITSLEYLKNAWSTAFDPILQFVTPWLTALIDKLASVGNAFSRFLGNLLGVSKVFQAVKGPTKNYAKSLDKTGKSAGGAAKKQKKLNDRLADFDDLHVLGKDTPTTGSGGGSGSGDDDKDKKRNNKLWDFAKVGKDLQKALKGMWASADFTELGKKVSDALYKALSDIKWDKIKTVASKLGKSLATFLNGALTDPKIWTLSGSTVAEIINTIGTSINGFLKNIKVDFGGGFANLINSFFKTIDWNQVNENIKLFGDQLIKNINSFFKTLDLGEISMDLSGLAQSLTSVLVSLIDDVDWKQVGNAFLSFGNAISEGIENALKGSNNPLIKVLGDTLSTIRQSANDLLPVISQIVGSVGQAIQAILPSLSSMLPQIVSLIQQTATTILPVLISAIQTLMPIITKIISTVLPVLSQVLTALSPIFTMLAETLLPAIANAISAILPVITPIITQLVSMLVPVLTNLVTTLLPVLQGIFNAILPIIQQLLPIIMQIVQTLLPVLSQILAQILPTIQQVTEAILPIVVKLLDIIAPLISDILTSLADLVGPILGLLSPILESITSTIGPLLDLLRPIVNIVRVLLNLVVSILQPIIELIAPIMKIINDCLSPIFSLFGLIGTVLEAVIVPLLKLLAGVIQTIVLPILKLLVAGVKLIVDAFGNVSTAVNFVISLFKMGFEQLGKWFKGWVNGFLDGVGGFINGFIKALNAGIRGINKLAIDIPDWVPVVGGKKLGFNIKELNTINIPKLAQGAVIPPNNEFMAVLGDQSHGTNIEAPLDTIKQAVAEVLANNNNQEVIRLLQQLIGVVESKNLVIGDKEIGKANARYTNQQKLIRGTSF